VFLTRVSIEAIGRNIASVDQVEDKEDLWSSDEFEESGKVERSWHQDEHWIKKQCWVAIAKRNLIIIGSYNFPHLTRSTDLGKGLVPAETVFVSHTNASYNSTQQRPQNRFARRCSNPRQWTQQFDVCFCILDPLHTSKVPVGKRYLFLSTQRKPRRIEFRKPSIMGNTSPWILGVVTSSLLFHACCLRLRAPAYCICS